jgi:hypothetical protein
MDPTAGFSALNALVLLLKQTAHFQGVPDEVSQLLTNITLADNTITIAQRMLRLYAPLSSPPGHPAGRTAAGTTSPSMIDNALRSDVTRSIEHVEKILALLRESVESCRHDLETTGTVGTKRRLGWMVWKKEEFVAKLSTLKSAVAALDREILRMEMKTGMSAVSRDVQIAASETQACVTKEMQGVERLMASSFPRSPAMRKRASAVKLVDDAGEMTAETIRFEKFDEEAYKLDAFELSGGSETPRMSTNGLSIPLIHVQSAPELLSYPNSNSMLNLDDERGVQSGRGSAQQRCDAWSQDVFQLWSSAVSSCTADDAASDCSTMVDGTISEQNNTIAPLLPSPLDAYKDRRRRRSNFI